MHDVFLSYSALDAAVVHPLARALRDRGLRVWLDAWEIQPGDSIPSRIEAGLDGAAVLVLCMSANAFGSDWAALESQTFRFRDPLNRDRRFIPVRLDDAPARGSLGQFRYVDWRERSTEEFEQLVRACQTEVADPRDGRPPLARSISLGHTDAVRGIAYHPNGTRALSASNDGTVRAWNLATGTCELVLEGHTGGVTGVAYHPNGTRAISASADNTVRVWNLTAGTCELVLKGDTMVWGVTYHPNGTHALSASADAALRVWNLATGTCERALQGHAGMVLGVAYHPRGTHALSASADSTVRVWNLTTGTCERILEGHTSTVRGVAYHPKGTHALSASADNTVRAWDLTTGTCELVLKGHTSTVWSVAYHPDGTHALSASADGTVRVWNLATGACEHALEGHTNRVQSIAYDPKGTHALSASADNTVRAWDLTAGKCERVLEGHSEATVGVARAIGSRALSASDDHTLRIWNLSTGACTHVLEGHSDAVRGVACDARGTRAVSASRDKTLRVWSPATGACERVLEGHADMVWSAAIDASGTRALSASNDRTARLWNLATGACERILKGHTSSVLDVTWSPTGTHALSASKDRTVRVWSLATGVCELVLKGHTEAVWSVACDAIEARAVSGSDDGTVRSWNLRTGACERVLEGHTAAVWGVACDPRGTRAVSGSADRTVRIWNLATGACEQVFEGHTDAVRGVAYDPYGVSVVSVAANGVMRVWNTRSVSHQDREGREGREATVSYTNAKVVLVGESQTGKSGLAMRLAGRPWAVTESTLGAWATQFKIPPGSGASDDGEREIWLWDFGGQADQRLIHQLYLGDATVAVLVFDGQREDVLPRLWDWDRALAAAGQGYPKLLAAGRTDMYPPRLSRAQLEEFCMAAGFAGYFETSAKSDLGCIELRDAVLAAIDWERVPWRSTTLTFQRVRREILKLKDSGRALTTAKELRDWLPAQIGAFEPAELDAVIGLLAGPGAVLPLGFGDYVLLRPELVNAYAQAVITTLRDDPLERGCITEELALQGELNYPLGFERLDEADERIVLQAMHKQLIERAICLRDHDPNGRRSTLLVFPSYYRRERPDRPGQPQPFMTYRFSGYLDDVYATLVVRLHHSEPFEAAELWRNAADLATATRHKIGLRLTPGARGTGELDLHCEPDTPIGDQALFARYVDEHLRTSASEITRLRTYICPKCSTPVLNRDTARKRLLDGKPDIVCGDCENRIVLWDPIEERLADPELRATVDRIREEAQVVLDNESRERLLVGEVYAAAARANQIAREVTVGDHGIDMEIEFKADDGTATGKKLYLQLKSGDSHLRKLKRDERRVFRIEKPRHADYWADQAFPVMLVIRDSEGAIEWMEIGELLRRQRETGDWPARQIAFTGERFDLTSIRRWRDKILD